MQAQSTANSRSISSDHNSLIDIYESLCVARDLMRATAMACADLEDDSGRGAISRVSICALDFLDTAKSELMLVIERGVPKPVCAGRDGSRGH